MITKTNQTVRKITARISRVDIELTKAYIQGAVHSHCNNNADEEFSVRILFGGDNKNWTNTPLQCIYDYHKYIGKTKDPADAAAKDVGWLFKSVLIDDVRVFEYVGKDTGSIYKLALNDKTTE